MIAGHERASSQSPHSWTLHAGAASRKKLFPHQSRKVGSCLLIEDHIKNARLQMFFLRTTEAGGWMWEKKKNSIWRLPGTKSCRCNPLVSFRKKKFYKKVQRVLFSAGRPSFRARWLSMGPAENRPPAGSSAMVGSAAARHGTPPPFFLLASLFSSFQVCSNGKHPRGFF